MKKILWLVLLLALASVVVWRVRAGRSDTAPNYRLMEVTRGDLSAMVSSTGTLEPVETVLVGAQVSGIVESVLVDFNDAVREGQVIARIDTTLLESAVAGSRASLARARAELDQAEREFTRQSALYDEKIISETEFNTAQYALDVARAGLQSAEVDLERAELNLGYATITSPIDGVVIDRSVDPGQTVQSSFSAPELFSIAGDLTSMEILVSVDESDIGRIAEEQETLFTVQAHPDDEFTGTVRQVRLQSVTQDNVVNYLAVVAVDNPDGRLLPGMTASVDFVVDRATDVLSVPNAALRYKPDAEIMQAVLERKRAERRARREAEGGGDGQGRGPGSGGPTSGGMPDDLGMLWCLDDAGDLDVRMVRTGLSDGSYTQVTGRDLEEGLMVVAGVTSQAAQASSNPFQQQQQRRGGGPPPPAGF